MTNLGATPRLWASVLPDVPFPVYEMISKPAVADSFQHQVAYVWEFVLRAALPLGSPALPVTRLKPLARAVV